MALEKHYSDSLSYAVLPCNFWEDEKLWRKEKRYTNDKEEARIYAKKIKGMIMSTGSLDRLEDYREKPKGEKS